MGQASVIELYDTAATSSEFTATVTADFEPELITSAQWGGLISTQLDSAQVAARGTLSLTALAQYQFTAAGSVTDDFQLFSRTWVSVYQVGAVPVYQEITLSMDVQVSASAQAEITATAEAQLAETVELGATYDGVSWTPYITNSESESLTASLTIVGGASAEIRLIPKIEIRFYTVIGGALSVKPYAESSLAFEDTTDNLDFLAAHPERLIHLTKFDASLGIEANVEVTLTVLGNNWDILPSTCVLGTGTCLYSFDPYTIFSIPTLVPDIPAQSTTGDTTLRVAVTDGVFNEFAAGSIIWEIFPDDPEDEASVTAGTCSANTTVTPNIITCEATLSSEDDGDYNVFISGFGILGTMGRQFTEWSITLTPDYDICALLGFPPGPNVVEYEGLLWQRCDMTYMGTWEEANSYCQELVLGGYSNWRLPTKSELKNMVMCSNGTPTPLKDWSSGEHPWHCGDGNPLPYSLPTIKTNLIQISMQDYWTSTIYLGSEYNIVSFNGGACRYISSVSSEFIRCVR